METQCRNKTSPDQRAAGRGRKTKGAAGDLSTPIVPRNAHTYKPQRQTLLSAAIDRALLAFWTAEERHDPWAAEEHRREYIELRRVQRLLEPEAELEGAQ